MSLRNILREKAFDTLMIHNAVVSQLSKIINPTLSYSKMIQVVIPELQHIADAFAKPNHKLHVSLDFIVDDRGGRVNSHGNDVWMTINIENMVDQTWPYDRSESEIREGINEISDEFCGLYIEYLKLCSGWNFYGSANKPFGDAQTDREKLSLKAANELLRHFGSPAAAIDALHNQTNTLASLSPAILKAMHSLSKSDLRLFLKDLYSSLK
jgi:hypothetical protein